MSVWVSQDDAASLVLHKHRINESKLGYAGAQDKVVALQNGVTFGCRGVDECVLLLLSLSVLVLVSLLLLLVVL